VRFVVIVCYVLLVPLLSVPDWCHSYYKDSNAAETFFVDCQAGSLSQYPVSGVIYVSSYFTGCVDILCQSFIVYMQYTKYKQRHFDKHDKIRNIFILFLLATSFINSIIVMSTNERRGNYVTDFLRPVVVVLLFKTQRSNFTLIGQTLKDSAITLILIFAYVAYFAFFATMLFYTTFEGVAVTQSTAASYWQFLVLLTTENYPDMFLIAYNANWISVLFFWVFIIFGIFYLLSILLATVFQNYKHRVEEISRRKLEQRLTLIEMFYD